MISLVVFRSESGQDFRNRHHGKTLDGLRYRPSHHSFGFSLVAFVALVVISSVVDAQDREIPFDRPNQTTTDQISFTDIPEKSDLATIADDAEVQTLLVAKRYRELAADPETPKDKLADADSQLRLKVQAAFEARWKLQEVRLQKMKAEIDQMASTHKRRKQLADSVIQRRMEELKNEDGLSWSQAAIVSKTANGPEQADLLESVTPTDPQLEGEWKLVTASGTDLLALKPDSRLQVADGTWRLSHVGRSQSQRVIVNTQVQPHQIDITDRSAFARVFTGIYKIDNDVLTIAWAAHDQPDSRPADFLNGESNIQVWKRVAALPKFASPEELLAYFDKACQGDHPDMETYVRVLTDDEATRFAGMLIASMGMMNRMMPFLMMASQVDAEDNPGFPIQMASMTKISALLRVAVSRDASPQSIQAFEDFTKPDSSFLTGQYVPRTVDLEAFSEKLKLAGSAVGDPRTFAIQLMQLMEAMSSNSDDSEKRKDKPKPEWVVSRDGDKAIAVNQNRSVDDKELASGKMELVRVDDTWKIAKIIDETNLTELASSVSGGLMGTDSNGNKIPLNSIFQSSNDAAMSPPSAAGLTLESAIKQQRFTEVDMTTRLNPNSLAFTLKGQGEFPKFVPEYLSAAYEKLKPIEDGEGVKLQWGPKQLELLRSIDPAMQFAKVGNTWDLQRFGKLAEEFVIENSSAENSSWPTQDSPWSADMLTRIAKTTGRLPDAALSAKHSDPEVRKRLLLLETMVRNNASSNWIEQEEIRLADLLLDAPVETLRLLVEHAAADDGFGYKRWLFVVSHEEFSKSLKSNNSLSCGQPVDSVLLTLILANLVGQSEAIDDRIGLILDPSPKSYATNERLVSPAAYPSGSSNDNRYITRQLHDLLSNDYAYRQFVIDALVKIYDKSKSQSLKQNIASFAPAIPILARPSAPATTSVSEVPPQ